MQLRDLNDTERRVLLWLVGTLVQVDGRIDPAELEELRFIESSLEIDLMEALQSAVQSFADQVEALQTARFVRTEARDTIREVVRDLATGDGELAPEEASLLAALEQAWP